MANKIALITGITGQDGSYLAELLLSKGYTVHGIRRQSSGINTGRIDHLKEVILHHSDMTDSTNLVKIIKEVEPDEIYNLAAISHVKISFDMPDYTFNANAVGVLNLLEAIRILGLEKKTRLYQASTSELYGKVQEIPQKETTPFYPRSPYAVAKQFAYWTIVNYREAYGIYACNGILFNHESPRRGEAFVTRKITKAVAAINAGLQDRLILGNLDAKRDWGHAKDYVEAMWLMLQQDQAEDYVIATGVTTTVRDFVRMAFKRIGVTVAFIHEGVNERAIIVLSNREEHLPIGKTVVSIDEKYLRNTEVDLLIGDATKARTNLGWKPKYDVNTLVTEMMSNDINQLYYGKTV